MPKARSRRSRRPSRAPSEDRSAIGRLKALPWAALLRASVVIGGRWRSLSEKDRARFTQLVRSSRGRLGNLDKREREDLRKLVRKFDLKGMGRELIPLVRGAGRGRKRGR